MQLSGSKQVQMQLSGSATAGGPLQLELHSKALLTWLTVLSRLKPGTSNWCTFLQSGEVGHVAEGFD